MAAGDVVYYMDEIGSSSFASGSLTCDASDPVIVYCGFQPKMIKLYYSDASATTNDKTIQWIKGMTAAYYYQVVSTDGIKTLVTSGGPTVVSNTTGEGFNIPAALMDDDGDTIFWMAFR